MWTKTSFKRWVQGLATPSRVAATRRLRVEALEDRLTPAFTLNLGGFVTTTGVTATTVGTVTTFEATASGAVLRLFDISDEFALGRDVVVTTGTGGSEAGDITTGAFGVGAGGSTTPRSLTFRTGSGANLVGDINLPRIQFNGLGTLVVEAERNVVFGKGGVGTTPASVSATATSATGSVSTFVGNRLQSPSIAVTAATGIGTSGTPFLTQAANFEATTGTGDVVVSNTGDLTIGGASAALTGVSSTGGDVSITTTGNLTVTEAVAAGGTATLTGSGVITISAPVTGTTSAKVQGGSGADAFTISSFGGKNLTVDGGAGSDVLTLDAQGAALTFSGSTVTVGSNQPISFTGFESLILENAGAIALTGDAANNLLVVTATGAGKGSYKLDGGPSVAFDGVTKFTFTGGGGNDTLRILNPAGGLFAPTGGISYDGGGQAGDAIENLGGKSDSGSYRVGPGTGDGVLTHVLGAVTQTVTFTGLAPATDTVASGTFTIFATDAANAITLDDGAALGDGLIRVSIDAFEPLQLGDKADLVIDGGDNVAGGDLGDTILVNTTEVSTNLVTVTVNADEGDDTVTVQAAAAGVGVTVNGGDGNDTLKFFDGVTLRGGTADGGLGTDTLDYAAYTSTVTVNLTALTATGTAGVTLFENATGGSGDDSLTGDGVVNVLTGNGGGDQIVGGKGADVMAGGLGDDTLVWNNGDGSDTIEGGGDVDTVVVNGSTAAGNNFAVGPNGSRVSFQRTNLIPFTLDIGTAERLTVNGGSAADSITVNSLVGVANLGLMTLNGLGGDDTFAVTPTTATVNIDGGAQTAADALTVNAQGFAATLSGNNVAVAGKASVSYLGLETLTVTNATAGVTIQGSAAADVLTLLRVGADLQATLNGGVVTLVAAGAFTFNGNDGNDRLVVDFAGGSPVPAGGITYVGGNQTSAPGDVLVVSNGTFTNLTLNFTNANSGSVVANGNTITYSGLEPVDITGSTATNLVINLPAGADTALLQDDGTANDGVSQITSPSATFEATSFPNPSGSLTINASGGDLVQIGTLDSKFATPVLNFTGGGVADVFRLVASNVLPDAAALTVTNATFDVSTQTESVGSLAGTGALTFGANGLLSTGGNGDTTAYAGTVTGPVGSVFIKEGAGTLSLSGSGKNFLGTFVINAGQLEVLNQFASGTLVFGPGTLAGTGSVAGLFSQTSTVNPGLVGSPTPATLTSTAGAVLLAGSTLAVNLGDTAPSGFSPSDRLAVISTVTLGATLALVAPPSAPQFGTQYLLIDNDGTDAVTGTFAGLPQGAIVTVSGVPFQISYVGGSGNDVVLTASPDVAISDVTQVEGNAGVTAFTFTLTLSGASTQTVYLDYATADGTATAADGDYTPAVGTVIFAPGQTVRTVTVFVTGDLKAEPTETFLVNFSNPVNVNLTDAQAVGTVTNDDAAPTISVTGASALEGAGFVTFTVNLSNPSSSTVAVNFATTGTGTATAGTDYTPIAVGTVAFAPGTTTQLVTVAVTADTIFEADETLGFALSGPTNATILAGTATGTILNDDAVPTISVNNDGVTEGNAGTVTLTFTVTLSNASSTPVAVAYDTADGSATTADGDYVATSGSVTFAPGVTSQTVTVTVKGDTKFEGDESLTLNLTNALGGVVADGVGVGTVLNDDAVPTISVTAPAAANEGNAGPTPRTFTVTLSNPSSLTVTVNYATTDGTATTADGDFQAAAGTLTFAPGEVTKSVTVFVTGDTKFEPTEAFALTLSGPANATLAAATATATVLNDDAQPAATVTGSAVTEGNAGTKALTFTVTLSNPSSLTVTVNYATADGTATAADGDYVGTTGTLTFAPGVTTQTFTVSLVGDTKFEADETLGVALSGPTNATIAVATATGTITNDDTVPTISVGDAAVTEGNAGTTALTFTVTLSNASSTAVTVNYATADGSATAADADYAAAAGTLTFAPGGPLTQTVTVLVTGDAKFEGTETLDLNLTAAAGGVIADGTGVGTVANDDAVPTISVAAPAATPEGNVGVTPFVFTVTLSNPSSLAVTVNYAAAPGTASVADGDYAATAGTLTFAPGEVTKTVRVFVTGDLKSEPAETFALTLSGPADATLATSSATATILNDDAPPAITIGDAAVNEGNGATAALTFAVTLSNPSSVPVTVNYVTADGTATTADGDYAATSGTLNFAPGEVSKTVTVLVNGDLTFEPNETLTVLLSGLTGGATLANGTGTGTAVNDDPLPTASVADASASESNAGATPLRFTVTLSNPSGVPVTVNYATSDGTAAAGGDYTAGAGAVIFAPGETTKTVTVALTGDTNFERDETLVVTLSSPAGASLGRAAAVGTLLNDDTQPTAGVGNATAAEGDAGAAALTFTVTLSNASDQTVQVGYATADGTATAADADYQSATGLVTFAPGETSKTVTVSVTGDRKFEPSETVLLNLTGASNATVAGGQGVGSVVNDDPVPTASAADATVAEGTSGTAALNFAVTLSNPSFQTVTVNYATADGTANAGSDYGAATGTVTFAPGETRKTVAVVVNGDTLFEPTETLSLTLSGPVNAGIGRATAVGSILNDAGLPTLAVTSVSVLEGNAGTAALNFALTLSAPSTLPVTVAYRTVDGTAKAGSDYAALTGSVTFAPGETAKTVTVAVNGDRAFEPSETLTLSLTPAAGATLAAGGGLGTIVNDDSFPTLAVGSGPGAAPQILTYDGATRTPQAALTSSQPQFTGGVRVAAGDVNGDGVADVVSTVGPGGGSTVLVRDGKTGTELRNFLAFEQSFTGGAYVAVGDFNGDGFAEVVVSPDEGGGGRVRVLDGKTGGVLADFLGIEDLAFRGGARVAVGDLTGDGVPDLVVGAGFGGGPRVAAFDGNSLRPGQAPVKLFADFFVFEQTLRNGVFVAVGDLDGDHFGDLILGGGPGGGPRVLAVSGADLVQSGGRQLTTLANFFVGDPASRGGVRVAAKDFDGDGRAEVVAGAGDFAGSKVTVYRGSGTPAQGVPALFDEFDAFPGLRGGVYVG